MSSNQESIASRVESGARGKEPRVAGFVRDVNDLICPDGHHISRGKLEHISESGYVFCGNVPRPGATPCEAGYHLTWFQRRAKTTESGPILMPYVVEIDWRDRAYIEGAQLDLFPLMEYLGQTYRPRARQPRRRAG